MVYGSTPLWYMGVLPYGIQEYSLMLYVSTLGTPLRGASKQIYLHIRAHQYNDV